MSQVACPICSKNGTTVISYNLHACESCKIVINNAYKALSYNDTYFLDEYKNQYGRTYKEDYSHIYAMAKKRLGRIAEIMGYEFNFGCSKKPACAGSETLRLLDIGSAMGFFLKCARDVGIGDVSGIEISEYASDFCRQEYGIEVINTSFSIEKITESYDIITSWFFIEHCKNSVEIMQKIYHKLNPGGVFAFSVPSIYGPSFTFHRESWAASHPQDHAVDFSPQAVNKILKNAGFKKVKVEPAGFHPERIVKNNSVLFGPFSVIYRLFSRITAFSDTIEVYAQK